MGKAKPKPKPAPPKKTPPKPVPKLKAAHLGDSVVVRMYCHGLGDCFLLSFPTAEAKKRAYVMIDCGVLLGTANATDKMRQVVEDIIATVKATNGDSEIDLLMVTHEHWDHVSGFEQVKDLFDQDKKGSLKFNNVWLAWTEEDGNEIADGIRADQKAKKKKLRAALAAFQARMSGSEGESENARPFAAARDALNVLDSFGPLNLAAAPDDDGETPKDGSTEAAMARVKSWATKFCKPSNVLPLPGAEGIKVYVLGPPEDLKFLKRDAPRKGKDEAYELHFSLAAAFDSFDDPTKASSPFDDQFGLTTDQAESVPFYRNSYGFADDPMGDAGKPWQRIENDWVFGAAAFALKMDSDTNNTSLAVAFELPGGRTLIFPGDAQMGNWESWADVEFKLGGGKTISGIDILNKAVFYKVGHHGSHNATRKEGGLEEMTGGDLVAMIPVDEEMAKKKRWKMPFEPLFTRLDELTSHRVLRADFVNEKFDKTFAAKVESSPDELVGTDSPRPLYVEYSIPI